MQITFTIPDVIALELNQIAQVNGFPNAKQMVIAYLKATIASHRGTSALAGIREAAEAQAATDTQGIS